MKKLHELTDLQLEIMNVIWSRREATVNDVYDALAEKTGLARKTIATLVMRLHAQGLLRYRTEGREYVYRATVSRTEVERETVGNVLSRLFRGDLPSLISQALDADDVEPGDVERIRDLIEAWERKQG